MKKRPPEEDIWLANIMRREDSDEVQGINRAELQRYRKTVKRINEGYEKQEKRITAGMAPLEAEIARKQYKLGYRLVDMSKKIRSQDELSELLSRLPQHSVTQTNIRFKENYIAALRKTGAPDDLINRISRLSGRRFVKAYYSITNASISFIYATSEAQSDDMTLHLETQWNEALRAIKRG